MNLRVELPPEVVDEIAAEVTRRVLVELRSLPTHDRPSAFVTIPEAAELLRCGRQRIDDLLSSGRLTRVKEGRRTLIRRDEIDAYLRS